MEGMKWKDIQEARNGLCSFDQEDLGQDQGLSVLMEEYAFVGRQSYFMSGLRGPSVCAQTCLDFRLAFS